MAIVVTDRQASRISRRAVVVIGCLVLIVALAVGGWWAYKNRVWLQNPEVKDQIVGFAKGELGVEEVDVGAWKRGGECIVAEVSVPGGEKYRVVLVSQNGEPKPYEPLWISQIYTLDDFMPDSDAWCGLMKTPAYVQDKNGSRIIG